MGRAQLGLEQPPGLCLIRPEAEMTWEHESEAAVPALLSTPLYIKAIYIQEGSKLQSSTLDHLFPPLQHHPENYSHQHPGFIIPPASHTKKCKLTDYHHKSVQKIKHMHRVHFLKEALPLQHAFQEELGIQAKEL